MAMKKHIVHVSYHTYVDAVVYADESVSYEDVLELGRQRAADDSKEIIDEILSNMEEDGNTEVVTFRDEVFKDKGDAYVALLERVQEAGGYIGIKREKWPEININCNLDGWQNHEIKVIGIFEGKDDSSPLKMVDSEGEAWDIDDYLGKDDITELYGIAENWY